MNVAPLCCPQCGAAVPLGSGAFARCSYCSQEVRLPPEHVALQAAHRGYLQNRELLDQLYGELGRPPSWLVRTLGRGTAAAAPTFVQVLVLLVAITRGIPPLGIAMVCALAYAFGYPVGIAMRAVLAALGRASFETPLSPYTVLPITVLLVIVFLGIPVIRWQRELVAKDVRIDAQASFAAQPPQRPGGPSLCRTCGAALDVPSGALGVPCAFCKSDNLVALPAAWVAEVRAHEHKSFDRIDSALDALREAGFDSHQSYFWLFVGGFITLLLSVPLAFLLDAGRFSF